MRQFVGRLTGAKPRAKLADCLAAYLEDLALRARQRTIRAAKLAADRFLRDFGDFPAEHIRAREVMAWRSERSKAGASNKTLNTELGYVKSALALAVRLELLDANPLAQLKALPIGARHRRRQARALSEHELIRLLDAAAREDLRHPDQIPREPLVRALALTGMRWGEAVSLTWSDFDDESLTLLVKAEESKTGIGRALPIDPDLADRLLELRNLVARILGRFPEPGMPIFLTPRGAAWAANCSNFRKHFATLLRAAGIARKDAAGRVICVHALRHTFATRLARAGVPLAQAQALTGHRTPQVLLGIYTHLQAEDARSAIEALRIPSSEGRGSREEAAPAVRRPASDRDRAAPSQVGSPGRARTYNPAVNSRRVVPPPPEEPDDPTPAA